MINRSRLDLDNKRTVHPFLEYIHDALVSRGITYNDHNKTRFFQEEWSFFQEEWRFCWCVCEMVVVGRLTRMCDVQEKKLVVLFPDDRLFSPSSHIYDHHSSAPASAVGDDGVVELIVDLVR